MKKIGFLIGLLLVMIPVLSFAAGGFSPGDISVFSGDEIIIVDASFEADIVYNDLSLENMYESTCTASLTGLTGWVSSISPGYVTENMWLNNLCILQNDHAYRSNCYNIVIELPYIKHLYIVQSRVTSIHQAIAYRGFISSL